MFEEEKLQKEVRKKAEAGGTGCLWGLSSHLVTISVTSTVLWCHPDFAEMPVRNLQIKNPMAAMVGQRWSMLLMDDRHFPH